MIAFVANPAQVLATLDFLFNWAVGILPILGIALMVAQSEE